MNITELSLDQLSKIEPLWNELNILHEKLSPDFKEYFAKAVFTKRVESLMGKDELVIYVAQYSQEVVAYCIASIDGDMGELDSLYVKPNFRKRNLGACLVEKCLGWLEDKNCTNIDIHVAHGNEKVLSFYERFGFKKRFHVLRINKA